MLSEKSNKHSYSVGKYLHEIFRIGKSIRTEIESVNAKDWKEDWMGNARYLMPLILWGWDSNIVKLNGGDTCTTVWIC